MPRLALDASFTALILSINKIIGEGSIMTGRARLQVLERYLNSGAVDEEKFDMSLWSFCAIGEASRIPSLRKEGLTITEQTTSWGSSHAPIFNGLTGTEAVARFFTMSHEKAANIFGASKQSPRQVANQIRRYLNTRRRVK